MPLAWMDPPLYQCSGRFAYLGRTLAALGLVLACGLTKVAASDDLVITQAKLGNIFLTTEPVEIPVTTTGDTVEWSVADFHGNLSGGPAVSVGTGGQATVRPGSGRPGYFELHLTAKRGNAVVAQADTAFAVVAPVDAAALADSPFGVMTHFAQGWNTDILPLLARAGLRQFRDEQYWQNVETTPGQYTFPDSYGTYMAAAAANGLEPLLELTFGNTLYDHDPANPAAAWAPCTDGGRAGYANYSRALVKKYGPQVPSVEVWNEYNGSFCPGPASADRATGYTQMLRAAYAALKAQQPAVRVLGGAAVLAPQPWFEDLFAAGALDCMDAAVIHPYFGTPEDAENPVLALQDAMRRYNHGNGAKPIWATECSRPDPAHQGRQDMARYLVRLLTLLRADGVERIYWYLMRDYDSFTTGLLRSDTDPLGRYAPTSAYPAYANLIRQLAGARFVRREATDLRTRFYLFNQGGGELRVLWSTAPPTRLVLTADGPLTVTDLMGVSQTLQPTNGTITLAVNDDPVYIRGQVSAVREAAGDLLLADSVLGFNGVQGAGPSTWTYGLYKGAANAYQTKLFQPMAWTRTAWDYEWLCPYPYGTINATSASPSYGDGQPVWAVRRWQSSTAGAARITGTASHINSGGDGTGVKVFVDGREVFSRTVGAPGGPASTTFDLAVSLNVGSLVDFVVTPGPGTDINFDAVDYRAQIMQPPPAPVTFNGWQALFFTPAQLADASISGDTANPAGDGVPNLLKYAFGLDPTVGNPGGLPTTRLQTINNASYLSLSFRYLPSAADLAYLVETTGDLARGSWTPGGVPVGLPVDNGDLTQTLTYRDDLPAASSTSRFMRLRVARR